MASSSNDGTEQPVSTLSEYEQARARNIEKNNARLRSLGLISVAEEKQSNDNAWGRTNNASDDDDDDSSSDEEYSEGNASSVKKRRKKKSSLPPREGSRKSRRLMHLPSEDDYGTPPNETAQERKARIQKEREDLVEECREARQRAAIEVAKAGVDVAGQKNPTATYEHCLMRVRTMNEKGLANRVSLFV